MRLRLIVLFACTPVAGICLGDKPDDPVPMKDNPKIMVQTISLQIAPAAMPKPALKYSLLPTYSDLVNADALGSYLKCFAEQGQLYYSKAGADYFEKYSPKKLADLPADAADAFNRKSFRNADAAARMDHIDWISVTPLKRDGINTLLPEVQNLRTLARGLAIRARGQLKAKKFAEATETAQTIFGLARHLDQHPTIIGNLVGAAIATVALQPLEEFAEQPGSPNLFWAYANLPSPLLEFYRGIEGERIIMKFELADFIDPEIVWDEGRTARAQKKLDELVPNLVAGQIDRNDWKPVLQWFRDRANDAGWVEGCRRRLIEAGCDSKKVALYPKEQAVLADVFRKYEIMRDDYLKYARLPNPQFEAFNIPTPEANGGDDLPARYFLNINSFLVRYRVAPLRLQQQLALLQTIEALRDYAALNVGKLPAALSDIKLPLPKDPVNEKDFDYSVADGKATLKGAIPKSIRESGGQRPIYEIQVRK